MIKIEKGIPAPELAGVGRMAKYPFSEMEVGDSFYTDSHTVVSAASYYAKRSDVEMKFVTRKEGQGRRVWRVA